MTFPLELHRKFMRFLLKMAFSLFSLIPNLTFAQLFTNNAAITINPGASIQINGSIQNNANSSINNIGTITVAEDFINNSGTSLFTPTLVGSVVMPSAIVQNISGNSVTRFLNLNLSGGTKTLLSSIEVGGTGNGVLSINNAILNLNSNTLTVLNPASSAITTTTGFIQSETSPVSGYGTFIRKVQDASGAGTYNFPFGTVAGVQIPVTFSFTSGITSLGQVSLSTYPTLTSNTPNNRPLPTGITSLVDFFGVENASKTIDRYWLSDVSGFTGAPVANMSFTYDESEWQSGTNVISEPTMLPQLHNFSTWSAPISGTINTTTNTMSISGLSSFNGVWTLAGNNSPLPVELLSFTATPEDNHKVICRWTTAIEINNDYYTVERSKDGLSFAEVGVVDGMGTTSVLTNYDFTDIAPFIGLSYYRLRQTDFDGGVHYSNVVPVWLHTTTPFMNVFPNPTSGEVFVWLGNLESNNSPYQIYDVAGRLVSSGQFQAEFANRLDFATFESGIYSLRVMNGSNPMYARVIVD